MKVTYRPEARDEFNQAVDYLALNGRPGIAKDFLSDIARSEAFIVDYPNASPRVGRKARRCQLRTFPYQLIYREEADEIVIYAIAHQSRRPGYGRKRISTT